MKSEVTEDKIARIKLALHLRYVCSISFGCICLVIVLNLCDDVMFQNCISVSSTVTSIILSVIAIILSVTGERTTNEIRNKVSDSVEHLEECTDKSSALAEELTKTMQQLNMLYENMNENIAVHLPDIKNSLDILKSQNGDEEKSSKDFVDKKAESISGFLNVLPKRTRLNIKRSFIFIKTETMEKHNSFQSGDIMQYLVNEGADTQMAVLVTGMTVAYMSAGMFNYNGLDKMIENIDTEKDD